MLQKEARAKVKALAIIIKKRKEARSGLRAGVASNTRTLAESIAE